MSVKDRYYNKKEYANLSSAQKKGLKEKRKHRGQGKGGGNSNKKVKFDERTIRAIASEVSQQMREEAAQEPEAAQPPAPPAQPALR